MKRKEKVGQPEPCGASRRFAPKEWLQRLLALPLGRCLPEIALCILLCCVLTGFVVMRLEQKEQYRRDTFEVYLQEHGQSAGMEDADIPEVQTAAVTPSLTDSGTKPDEADGADDVASVTVDESVTIYATPSGKRYHYDAFCPGKNGQQITWDEALSRSLTPCKKCVK